MRLSAQKVKALEDPDVAASPPRDRYHLRPAPGQQFYFINLIPQKTQRLLNLKGFQTILCLAPVSLQAPFGLLARSRIDNSVEQHEF